MSLPWRPQPRHLLSATLLLATLAAGWVIDWHVSHGFAATWFAGSDSERHSFAHTHESVASFDNYRRPLARVVGHWDFDKDGVPTHFPPIDTELRATLHVPTAGTLHVETPNEATVLLDGRVYDGSTRIEPGAHAILIRWQAEAYKKKATHWERPQEVALHLTWTRGLTRHAVPRAWLEAPPPWSTRLLLWAAFAACATLAWWLLQATRFRTGLYRFSLLAVVVTAAICRLHAYDVVPDFKDNDDELFATWNGWSLLSEGRTRGWTLWPQRYDRSVEIEKVSYFHERPFYVVTPYLEHPPLLHLWTGVAAKMGGAKHWLHARLRHVRLVPIALSLASLGLLFLLARELSLSPLSTALAGLWFATTPHMVLQQRVVKEEALVTPTLLIVVWLCLRFVRTRSNGTLWTAAAIAGLAVLIKVPAVVMAGVVAAFALSYAGYGALFRCLLISLLCASSILLYAAFTDWDLFWHVQGVQASVRKPHWNVFLRFFTEPMVNHDRIGAGWQLLSWLATVATALISTRKVQLALVLPVVLYMIAIAIPSGSWSYGWYALPLYPFLSLGIGIGLAQTLRTPHPLWVSLFVFLGLFYTATYFLPDEVLAARDRWSSIRLMVSAATVLTLAPAFWNWLRPNPYLRALCQASFAGIIGVHTLLCCAISLDYENRIDDFANLDEQSSRDRSVPGPYWKRSP